MFAPHLLRFYTLQEHSALTGIYSVPPRGCSCTSHTRVVWEPFKCTWYGATKLYGTVVPKNAGRAHLCINHTSRLPQRKRKSAHCSHTASPPATRRFYSSQVVIRKSKFASRTQQRPTMSTKHISLSAWIHVCQIENALLLVQT